MEIDCDKPDSCVGDYFGTDCELVKELAVRLNFTARLMGPADGLDYGFKVESEWCSFLVCK